MAIFKVIYYLIVIFNLINSLQIDIKRKNYVEVNNIKVDTNHIHDYLEENEKEFLFGNLKHKPEIQFVHVSKKSNKILSRRKRSKAHSGQISFQLEDNGEEFNLNLEQSPKLIDDAFILINRYENFSQFISNSHKLAVEYERCFYRNENSALDLCDDKTIRGVFRHKLKDFLIHPLPERFSKNAHIVIEANNNVRNNIRSHSQNNDLYILHKNLHFEPVKDEFIEFNQIEPNISTLTSPDQIEKLFPQSAIGTKKSINFRNLKTAENLFKNKSYNKVNQEHNTNNKRFRRFINSEWPDSRQQPIPKVLHIETAIFVDKDLFKHMTKNFPKNTETHLIRFVLAMVNGVQLLYHHPSLGHQINFVLKRLEILHSDPKELRRSSDIDIYLNNFCMWQKKLNPVSDSDAVHYDHAVILTGLDLYVIGKNGKVSSQVVGLAPVAGMCTSTSSCTINEGKHFESVFVVAHEIGHNLGMRHDTHENNCDSSLYIMSPTLGSGKITWSKCSRTYLNNFLETDQAKCLFDRGQFSHSLDHSAEGLLPGERFDADKQCMLKYGKDSIRSRSQNLADICQDLNCQRGRYTWTSHPALEGTECSEMMWCRSGLCVMKAILMESYTAIRQIGNVAKATENGFLDNKSGQLSRPKVVHWNEWGQPTVCESGCLYGETGRLKDGSTGLQTFVRNCLSYTRNCMGKNKKYVTCIPKQCYTIKKTTIAEFSTQICERAKKFDNEIIGEGVQIVGETVEESCKVYCKTKTNGTKSRSWTFPDGTTCHTNIYNFDDKAFCINGRCELFSCDNSTNNYFKLDQSYCPQVIILEEEESQQSQHLQNYQENGRDYKSIRSGQDIVISASNEHLRDSNQRNKFHQSQATNLVKKKTNLQLQKWPQATARLTLENEWLVRSGCHFNCIDKAKGIQIITLSINRTNNIQLCSPKIKPCDKIQTTTEYAKTICARYKLKVNGLSGYGMQISSSIKDPDRSCRVACQDQILPARFYLVNGPFGMFPFGTKCSKNTERYCVNDKCLEFGDNEIPLTQSYLNLPFFRNKRALHEHLKKRNIYNEKFRQKRSYKNYETVKIIENITQSFIDNIIDGLSLNFKLKKDLDRSLISNDHIEFSNPIYILYDELIQPK